MRSLPAPSSAEYWFNISNRRSPTPPFPEGMSLLPPRTTPLPFPMDSVPRPSVSVPVAPRRRASRELWIDVSSDDDTVPAPPPQRRSSRIGRLPSSSEAPAFTLGTDLDINRGAVLGFQNAVKDSLRPRQALRLVSNSTLNLAKLLLFLVAMDLDPNQATFPAPDHYQLPPRILTEVDFFSHMVFEVYEPSCCIHPFDTNKGLRYTYDVHRHRWGLTPASTGISILSDALELMMDLIFQDTSRWCEEAGSIGIAREGVDSEQDLFRNQVYGRAFAVYLFATGRIRSISFWTLATCIIGENALLQLLDHVHIIKKVDPDAHDLLQPWTSIDEHTILVQGKVTAIPGKDGQRNEVMITPIHPALLLLDELKVHIKVRIPLHLSVCFSKLTDPPPQYDSVTARTSHTHRGYGLAAFSSALMNEKSAEAYLTYPQVVAFRKGLEFGHCSQVCRSLISPSS